MSKCSVIIPTCGRPGELDQCLTRLIVQRAPSDEVIVSDDSSDNKTQLLIAEKYPGVRYLRGPMSGPGANRNTAARQAQGEWLVFIDDDCLPGDGWLAAYRKAFEGLEPDPETLFAGSTLASGSGSLLWEAPEYHENSGLPPSCNFAISSALFSREGGFDERYRISFEDMEFFARLLAVGVGVRFVEGAHVHHPRRRIGSARILASRWEARVISTLDFGAAPWQVLVLLPRHVALVILSRFRGKTPGRETLVAASLFAREFLIFLCQLPGWVWVHSRAPRSTFWTQHRAAAPPRFGL